MITLLAPTLLALAQPAAAATPAFRPDLFFEGRTRGTGTVTTLTSSRPRMLAVEGTGRILADGTLVLDQSVRMDGESSRRTFSVRRAADGRWRGMLTDAAGPVEATVAGDTMRLSYRMKKGGMRMNQTLTLQPGGRVVLNRARVTLLGVTVARIEETIEKLD